MANNNSTDLRNFKKVLEYFIDHLEFLENKTSRNISEFDHTIKTGKGHKNHKIQTQIDMWSHFGNRSIRINIEFNPKNGYMADSNYLNWDQTDVSIYAGWDKATKTIKSLLIKDRKKNNYLEMTVNQLGLFKNNGDSSNLSKFFDFFYNYPISNNSNTNSVVPISQSSAQNPHQNDDFSDESDNEDFEKIISKWGDTVHGRNIIFYGAPGTGKSHTVDEIIKGINTKYGLGKGKAFRTTFHPDTDYASFVGCYKPGMADNNKDIEYKFSEQVFLKAYIYAWQNPSEQVYLVIEEINRGNCAQIFGDIFQLLDREPHSDGYSKYLINPDREIIQELYKEIGEKTKRDQKQVEQENKDKEIVEQEYKKKLEKVWNEDGNKDIIEEGALGLPGNLTILATMNTSDQSLFPMDSAFKRRWEWEYVEIDYTKIRDWWVEIDHKIINWKCVLKCINNYIRDRKNSTDKQLGEFFIVPKDTKKHIMTFEEFKKKVLFYLFNDVFKGDRSFFRIDDKPHFFEDLFTGELDEPKVYKWMAMDKNMGISNCPKESTQDSAQGSAPDANGSSDVTNEAISGAATSSQDQVPKNNTAGNEPIANSGGTEDTQAGEDATSQNANTSGPDPDTNNNTEEKEAIENG